MVGSALPREGWKPPVNPFLKYIYLRTHYYKKSWVQAVTGQPGSGKSYCCLSMGCYLDPHFDISNVFFKPSDFIEGLNNVKRNGTVLFYDEPEVSLSNKKWQSIQNMATTDVVNICRYKKPIILFALPEFTRMDKSIRLSVNCVSWVTRKGNDNVTMQPKLIMPQQKNDDIVFASFQTNIKKQRYKCGNFVFRDLPPKYLMDAYEEKMVEMKDALLKRRARELKSMEHQEGMDETESLHDLAQKVLTDWASYTSGSRNTLSKQMIRVAFDLSHGDADAVKSLAEHQKKLLEKPHAV